MSAPDTRTSDEVLLDILANLVEEAIDRGLAKGVCSTHDGVPMLEYELEDQQRDEPPCIQVLRVWTAEEREQIADGVPVW